MTARRHQAVLIVSRQLDQPGIDAVVEPLRQHGVLGQQDPAHPLQRRRLLGRLGQPQPQQQQVQLTAELRRRRDQLGRVVGEPALMMFDYNQYAHGSTLASFVDLSIRPSTWQAPISTASQP
ncbi:hypothetical protein D3C86_1272430 [compost metagenome]